MTLHPDLNIMFIFKRIWVQVVGHFLYISLGFSVAVEPLWMCCSDIVNLVGSGYKNTVVVREQVKPILHLMCFNSLESTVSIRGKKISKLPLLLLWVTPWLSVTSTGSCIPNLLQFERAAAGRKEVSYRVPNKQVSMQQPIVSRGVESKECQLPWGAWNSLA